MNPIFNISLLTFLYVFFICNISYSQTLNFKQKQFLPDSSDARAFGKTLCISENYAIATSDENLFGYNKKIEERKYGKVYVYEKNANGNWVEKQVLISKDFSNKDLFGKAICLNANLAIIGAPKEDEDSDGGDTLNNSGAAYIFERNESGNWNQIQKIVASGRTSDANFGCSIAMYGDYLIVGAENNNNKLFNGGSGVVYIFKKRITGQWEEIQAIKASDKTEEDRFGKSINIIQDYLIIGAQLNGFNNKKKKDIKIGKAYLFKLNGEGKWDEVQKILSPEKGELDLFADNVNLNNDYAFVSASFADTDANRENTIPNAGAVYVFKKKEGQWIYHQKLTPSDRARISEFGCSISLSNNCLVIGAVGNQTDSTNENIITDAGAAYIFKLDDKGDWIQYKKIVAFDRSVCDQFGYSVAINKMTIIISAISEDKNGYDNKGAMYIYEFK